MSGCIDLIGMPYRLGADGSDGYIDCIHMVYKALEIMDVPTPAFKSDWYTMSSVGVTRDILHWGVRVKRPYYNGDVALLPKDSWVFGAVWDNGILHISRLTMRVAWCPLASLTGERCFRMRENFSPLSDARKKNT